METFSHSHHHKKSLTKHIMVVTDNCNTCLHLESVYQKRHFGHTLDTKISLLYVYFQF